MRAESCPRPSLEAPPMVTKRAGGRPSGAFLLLKPVSLLAVPFQGGPSDSDGASSPEPVPQKIESLFRSSDEGPVGMFFQPQSGEGLVQDSNRMSKLPRKGPRSPGEGQVVRTPSIGGAENAA